MGVADAKCIGKAEGSACADVPSCTGNFSDWRSGHQNTNGTKVVCGSIGIPDSRGTPSYSQAVQFQYQYNLGPWWPPRVSGSFGRPR